MQIISKVDLSYLNNSKSSTNNNFIEQMKFNDNTNSNYIQMSNLSSGDSSAPTTSSINSTRNSFRYNNQELSTTTTSSLKSVFKFPLPPSQQTKPVNDLNDVEFIDDVTPNIICSNEESKKSDSTEEDPGSAVYNFPWDFKLKSLMQSTANAVSSSSPSTSSSSTSSSSNTTTQQATLQPPQFPPPSKPIEIHDETQYCSPWDLKLQEEMFKMMSQQQAKSNNGSSGGGSDSNSRNNSLKLKESEATSSSFKKTNSEQYLKRGDEINSSIKSNKSLKETSSANTTIESSSLNTGVTTSTLVEQNEYSPPWEHKQSLLLQNLTSTNASNSKSISPPISAPLATSSAISTLTNSANINQNNSQAINSLFNQFGRTRLSTRSNTSSSSSSHSSTSSLSTNSPPSIPPPPLPPSIPPPPPPTSSLTASLASSSSLNNNNTRLLQQQQQQQQQQMNCQSPRLIRHVCQNTLQSTNSNIILTRVNNGNLNSTTNSTASFAIVPMIGPTGSNIITCPIINNNTSFLNEANSFCTWNTNNNANTSNNTTNTTLNTFDTLTNDEANKHTFLKHINTSTNTSSRFVYNPQATATTQSHFQTVPSTNQLLSGEIQVALPVTALVFSQTPTLSSNLIPIHQQMSSNTLSHLQQLERQIWFHGRITRKQAETILANKSVGSFLVRQSESGNANDFSLSLVGSGCVHMRICMKNGEFILGQCSQPFNSIVKMIDHYGKVEVPIKGAQHVKLTNPVPASI